MSWTNRHAATRTGPAPVPGSMVGVGVPPSPAPVPTTRWARRRIHRVEARTVFVVSFLFYLGLFIVLLVAAVVVWEVAVAAGAVHHLQHFAVRIGFSPIGRLGHRLLRAFVFVGLIMVGIGTIVTTIVAIVYNLVSDLTGGVRVVVEDQGPPRRPVV